MRQVHNKASAFRRGANQAADFAGGGSAFQHKAAAVFFKRGKTAFLFQDGHQFIQLGAAADSEGGKASPATFDAGIGVSAVTAVTSLAGLALLRRKRRDGE